MSFLDYKIVDATINRYLGLIKTRHLAQITRPMGLWLRAFVANCNLWGVITKFGMDIGETGVCWFKGDLYV